MVGAIGGDCVSREKVEEYSESVIDPPEPWILSLFLIPWVAYTYDKIGSVLITGFRREGKLNLPEEILGENKYRTAVLLDILDQAGTTGSVVETLDFLDQAGFPKTARARFSRGGTELPQRILQLYPISKEKPADGYDTLKQKVHHWIDVMVRGKIISGVFQDATKIACHRPIDLQSFSLDIRQEVCRQLVEDDAYGIWRWCQEAVCQEPMLADGPHRWLAGKAFQTSEPNLADVPLTAVVAICEGVRFVEARMKKDYFVESKLREISACTPEKINTLSALGFIKFSHGDYGGFAVALRDWLKLPEQFDQNNGRIVEVQIGINSNRKAVLVMRYSRDLRTEIFAPIAGARIGRVCIAWNELRRFAEFSDYNDKMIKIGFAWSERKPS